jgi:PAS domain S-box-containing protein
VPHPSSGLPALLPEITRTFPGPALVLDPEGCILHLNPAAAVATGEETAASLGRPMAEFLIAEEDRAGFRSFLDRARSGEAGEPVEARLAGGEGPGRPVIWHVAWLEGEPGDPGALLVTGTDVTDMRGLQARAEALSGSEARFSGIVSIASDAIISIDAGHRIVLFNRGAEVIFGYRAEEMLGEPLDRLLPSRAREVHRRHVEAFDAAPVPARRMAERQSIQGVRRSGEEFPAEASILKLTVGGEPQFTVVLRDASERVRHERGEAFLSRVSEVLAQSLDGEGHLRRVAELAVDSLFDLCVLDVVEDPEESVRRVEGHHRDPEHAEELAAFLEAARNGSRGPRLQRILEDGSPLLIPETDPAALDREFADGPEAALLAGIGARSVLAVPLQARGRRLGVILGVRAGNGQPRGGEPFRHAHFDARDLGVAAELGRRAGVAVDNARLYREARRALEARDEVLGAVSHDLGNPLQAIFIGLEALERSRAGRAGGRPGQEEYYLTAIRRSVDVMERLIQDLLEVRRMEAGHLELDAQPQSVGPLVEEALQMLLPLARVKNIRIVNEVPAEGLPTVRVDRDRIQQVLSNLVGNAVKHTGEDGQVHLTCETLPGELRLHVRDTGSGIPREDLGKVFDRFWRAGNRRGRGIGLGLAIARGIVRGHGGQIWVESELGVGSVFSFSLPLPGAEPAPETGTGSPSPLHPGAAAG